MESFQFESDPTGSSQKFRIWEILNLLTDADSSTDTTSFSDPIFLEGVQKKFGLGVQFKKKVFSFSFGGPIFFYLAHTDRQTHRQTDMADIRLIQPWGQVSKN